MHMEAAPASYGAPSAPSAPPSAPSAPSALAKKTGGPRPSAPPISFDEEEKKEAPAPTPKPSEQLEEERRLKAALLAMRKQLDKVAGQDDNKLPEAFYEQIQSSLALMEAHPPGSIKNQNTTQTVGDMINSRKYDKGTSVLASSIRSRNNKANTVFICAAPAPDEDFPEDTPDDALVCVMDIDDSEWWQLVEPGPEDLAPVKPPIAFDSDESYEMIEEEDVEEAIQDYISKNIQRNYPGVRAISPEQLQSMVRVAFKGLEEKGTLGKLWEWGQFSYTVYGWGTYALAVYRQPAYALMAANATYTAAKWILLLVL